MLSGGCAGAAWSTPQLAQPSKPLTNSWQVSRVSNKRSTHHLSAGRAGGVSGACTTCGVGAQRQQQRCQLLWGQGRNTAAGATLGVESSAFLPGCSLSYKHASSAAHTGAAGVSSMQRSVVPVLDGHIHMATLASPSCCRLLQQ